MGDGLDLVVMLVLCIFFSVVYELSGERYLGVFAWMSWWLFGLVWFTQSSSWVLCLLAFAAGLIYFIRILIEAVQPGKLRRMIARLSV